MSNSEKHTLQVMKLAYSDAAIAIFGANLTIYKQITHVSRSNGEQVQHAVLTTVPPKKGGSRDGALLR